MSKLRILFITHAYYNKGGVEEHVRDLSEALLPNTDNYVLTPVQIGRSQHYQLLHNAVIKEIFPGNYVHWPIASFKDNLAVFALEKSIEQVKPDIIHIHHLQNWPLEILNQILKSKIPAVLSVHDYFLATPLFTLEFSEHPKELLSAEYSQKVFGADISDYLRMRREIYTSSLNKIKALICPSINAQKEISKIIPANYTVVPHGIRLFRPRKKMKSEKNVLRFGYIGSLIRQKGMQTLMEAFKDLYEKHRIELNVFGGGYELEKIKNFSGLKYQGTFSKQNLSAVLSTFDVGIIPSTFKETYCYTLSEMQHAKIPVIASEIGAIPERINQKSGLLFKPGCTKDLQEKVIWMTKNFEHHPWEIKKQKSLTEMSQEYFNIYQSILGKQP